MAPGSSIITNRQHHDNILIIGEWEEGGYGDSLTFAQFFCKLQTARKKVVY